MRGISALRKTVNKKKLYGTNCLLPMVSNIQQSKYAGKNIMEMLMQKHCSKTRNFGRMKKRNRRQEIYRVS